MEGDESRGSAAADPEPTDDADDADEPDADAPAAPFRTAAPVEGEAFEEFRVDVNRAFPEDEISIDELVALPPEELDDRAAGEVEGAPTGPSPGRSDDGKSATQSADATDDADPDVATERDTRSSDAAARFVDAITARELTDEERERLRTALGIDAPTSTEVRLRHLQSNVADLEAYVDAIEAFIDERGTARELLDGFERRLQRVSGQLEEQAEAIDEVGAATADHHQRIETTDSRVSRVEHRLDDLADRVASLEASRRGVGEALADAAAAADASD